MGTIAQKLEYLNDTRLLLKDNINKINNVLDDNSTFRSYPQQLFNGYLDILNNGTDTLWNNLEKVSASGEEATLENVETAPMKMVLNGNTSQDTTSGKNLIKIVGLSSEEEKTKTVNGVTFTVNDDGTIKVEGTNSGSSRILQPVTYESAVTGEAGTYYYFANSPSQPKRLEMACFVDDKYEYPNSYGTTPWSKTATTSFTIRNIYFVINAGETVNNVYYVILTRNVDPQPYEPYTGGQPSPSPDYPQQVKVVKGENVVSVQGKNLYTTSNLISSATGITIIDSNSFSYEGSVGWSGITTYVNNLKKNTDYVIYFEGTPNTAYCNIKTMDNITITEKYIYYFANGIPFNSGDNTSVKVIIYPRTANGTFYNIQLEEGTAKTDFVPYSKTDYPINLGDIELCKINTYKDYFHKDSGKWYVHKEIRKVVLDGSESWGTNSSWNYTNTNNYTTALDSNGTISELRTNYFKYVSNTFALDTNGIASRVWTTHIIFRINKTIAPTIEDFKTWLSTHNTIVYCVPATPTEEEITNTTLIEQLEAISKAKSVKDKTYITQTNDELPFILDVEAIKEYEVI